MILLNSFIYWIYKSKSIIIIESSNFIFFNSVKASKMLLTAFTFVKPKSDNSFIYLEISELIFYSIHIIFVWADI